MIKGVAFAFQFLTGCHVIVREPMSKIQSFAGINTNDYIELKDYTRRPNSLEKVSNFGMFARYLYVSEWYVFSGAKQST